MKKHMIFALGGLAIALAGCTEEQIASSITNTCQWVPTAKLVRQTVTGITGLPPGAGVAFDTAQTAIDAICAAAEMKKTAGKRALVFVEVRNRQTGDLQRIILQGHPTVSTGR